MPPQTSIFVPPFLPKSLTYHSLSSTYQHDHQQHRAQQWQASNFAMTSPTKQNPPHSSKSQAKTNPSKPQQQTPTNPLCGMSAPDFLSIHSAINNALSSSTTPTSSVPPTQQEENNLTALAEDLQSFYKTSRQQSPPPPTTTTTTPSKLPYQPPTITQSLNEPLPLKQLRQKTLLTYPPELSSMLMPSSQTGFLYHLLQKLGARKVLEVGCFTGMGVLVFVMALLKKWGKQGEGVGGLEVRSYDIDTEAWEDIGKEIVERCIEESGREGDMRVEVVERDGVEYMEGLLETEGEGCLDFVFVDGEKGMYRECFDLGVRLVRKGGVVVVDDWWWSGRVQGGEMDQDSVGIRNCKEFVERDERVEFCEVDVGDGLLIAMKK